MDKNAKNNKVYVYVSAFYNAQDKSLKTYTDLYKTEEDAKKRYANALEYYQAHPNTEWVEEVSYGENFKAELKDGSIARGRWFGDTPE